MAATNPIFDEIWREGIVHTREGEAVPYEAGVSPEFCIALRNEVSKLEAPRVLEIGMAFGASSVHLADGMADAGGGTLTSIDHTQSTDWRGIGAYNVERAGHAHLLTLVEEPSHRTLPRLAAAGEQFDFILIDGGHHFEDAFIDLLYGDKLLIDGGVMAFDDCGQPGVAKAIRFLEAYRSYELIRTVPSTRVAWRRIRRSIYRRARWLYHLIPLLLNQGMVSEPATFDEQGRFYRKQATKPLGRYDYFPF